MTTYSTADINRMIEDDKRGILGDYKPRFGTKRTTPEQDEAAMRHFEAQRGGVGVLGKTLGMLGLDESGARAKQSWGDAARATMWAPMDYIEGLGQAVTAPYRALTGQMPNYLDDRDAYLGEGLNVAGNITIGGVAVPRPANALAANSVRELPPSYIPHRVEKPAFVERGYHGASNSDLIKKVDSALTGDLLYANGKQSALPGTIISEAGNNALAPQGIRAYHGSPHDFDRFDISKIGTGEGAQAFGHGLYFAESDGVARSYKNKLSDGAPTKAGQTYAASQGALSDTAYSLMKMNGGNVDAAIARAEQLAKTYNDPSYTAVANELRNGDWGYNSSGRLYEVSINADPEDFLNWDKPLSQQSEKVRKALSQAVVSDLENKLKAFPQGHLRRPEIESLLEKARAGTPSDNSVEVLRNNPKASEYLREAGIPGIR